MESKDMGQFRLIGAREDLHRVIRKSEFPGLSPVLGSLFDIMGIYNREQVKHLSDASIARMTDTPFGPDADLNEEINKIRG